MTRDWYETGLPPADAPVPAKRGRKPLPANLPRTRIEYDLPDDRKTCPCCSGALHRMGEEVTEQLHIEVKASVLQHARLKYACRHCERHDLQTPIVTAPMPTQPLPGSHASASVIAAVTAGKFVDGTPLYRMEEVLARAKIAAGRGTRPTGSSDRPSSSCTTGGWSTRFHLACNCPSPIYTIAAMRALSPFVATDSQFGVKKLALALFLLNQTAPKQNEWRLCGSDRRLY